jgi:hypothetical protein
LAGLARQLRSAVSGRSVIGHDHDQECLEVRDARAHKDKNIVNNADAYSVILSQKMHGAKD